MAPRGKTKNRKERQEEPARTADFSSVGQSLKKIERSTVRHTKRFIYSRLDRWSKIKRPVLSWVFLVCVLMGLSMAQWINARNSYMVLAPNQGGVYSEGVIGPLDTLNPIFAKTSAERSVSKLLFASLYRYDRSGHIGGDLASSLTVNEQETEYTISLLPGTEWSDGSPLTAEDVIFTVELLRNEQTNSEILGWQSFRVELVDSRTVKFILPGPYAPFQHALTFPILPKHIYSNIKPTELRERALEYPTATSGPFTFKMLQTVSQNGDRKVVHLSSNPKYRHGKPMLSGFQLNVYPSKDDIVTSLKNREILATPELVYKDLPDSIQKVYSSHPLSINNGVYALFNTRDGILQDPKLRQALFLSIDREKLRTDLLRSTERLDGPVLNSQVLSELPSGDTYDVDIARELLDEEGWLMTGSTRQKDGQTLSINLVSLRGSEFSKVATELAEKWRKELGIRVDAQIVDPQDPAQSVLQSVLQPRQFDVLVYELVLGGDPDAYTYWHSSQASEEGLNFSNYSSVIADEALSSGRSKRADRLRAERYKTFVKRWQSDLPAIPLYQPKMDYIQSKAVKSISEDTRLIYAEDRYSDVLYWSVREASVYKTP